MRTTESVTAQSWTEPVAMGPYWTNSKPARQASNSGEASGVSSTPSPAPDTLDNDFGFRTLTDMQNRYSAALPPQRQPQAPTGVLPHLPANVQVNPSDFGQWGQDDIHSEGLLRAGQQRRKRKGKEKESKPGSSSGGAGTSRSSLQSVCIVPLLSFHTI